MSSGLDIITMNQLSAMVENAVKSRAELVGQLTDPRRDLNKECGYPDTAQLTPQAYRDMYDREAVAARVVNVLPTESWQSLPCVYEDESEDVETEFEQAWEALGDGLRGTSWHHGSDEENPVWEYLLRADIQSGIGQFSVLLLGLDDGKDLREPVDGITERGEMQGTPGERKLLYLRSFDQSLVEITQVERDVTNPRYGQPVMYSITFTDHKDNQQATAGTDYTTRNVHWTRVIHLADNLSSSDVFGVPRMRAVWNRLLDLQKLYGGSAEMYWRGAFPGISVETHPSLGGDVAINESALKDSMEDYMNGLQRYFALMGMSAKSLAPQVVDPTPQISTQIEAICILLGIPKRVFMGSERGELASGQDDKTWNDRLASRQRLHVTPRIIVPFIDRCIMLGVLPQPVQYSVDWPDLNAMAASEQATIAQQRADAYTKYINGNVEALIKPIDWLTREMGYSNEEALAILQDDAEYSAMEERAAQAKAMMEATTLPETTQGDQASGSNDQATE